jgi:hypothetical protein
MQLGKNHLKNIEGLTFFKILDPELKMVLVPFQILEPTSFFVSGKRSSMPLHFLNPILSSLRIKTAAANTLLLTYMLLKHMAHGTACNLLRRMHSSTLINPLLCSREPVSVYENYFLFGVG